MVTLEGELKGHSFEAPCQTLDGGLDRGGNLGDGEQEFEVDIEGITNRTR